MGKPFGGKKAAPFVSAKGKPGRQSVKRKAASAKKANGKFKKTAKHTPKTKKTARY